MIPTGDDAETLLWDCFHDGSIVKVTQIEWQVYEVEIEIEYLIEEMLGVKEGAFRLALFGCEKFEFEPFESSIVTEIEKISKLNLEILSSEKREGDLRIFCSNNGILKLKYQSFKLYLEGSEITLTQLNNGQQSYWDKFGS